MTTRFTICSRQHAQELLLGTPARFGAVVSIGDPGQTLPLGLTTYSVRSPVLRMEFNDVDNTMPGVWVYPHANHVHQMINFIRGLKPVANKLEVLIHCFAGRSRSVAAGFIMRAALLPSGREDAALRITLNDCVERTVRPNMMMVKIADHVMGRCGSMIDAVEDTFQFGSMY